MGGKTYHGTTTQTVGVLCFLCNSMRLGNIISNKSIDRQNRRMRDVVSETDGQDQVEAEDEKNMKK